tara:strand:+ start:93 stop:293 length:201 start_codon:yes stop_codon:yes gene_type:complete
LKTVSGIKQKRTYRARRTRHLRDSLVNLSAFHQALGFHYLENFEEGLKGYMEWAKKEIALGTQNKG